MSLSKHSKIVQLLNYRLRVTITDGRTFLGQFLAFDKHMNLVLADCDELRVPAKQPDTTVFLIIN